MKAVHDAFRVWVKVDVRQDQVDVFLRCLVLLYHGGKTWMLVGINFLPLYFVPRADLEINTG